MFICLFAPPRGFAFRTNDGIPRAKLVTNQLVRLGRVHSPRIEIHGDNLVVFEVHGLQGRSGGARALGAGLRRAAADQGLYLRIAVASSRTVALLVVQERGGLTVIEPGQEVNALSSLSLDVMRTLANCQRQGLTPTSQARRKVTEAALAIPLFALLSTLRRWGLSTLGDLTRMSAAKLSERLGPGGMTLQGVARGEEVMLVQPSPVRTVESTSVLEWPTEATSLSARVARQNWALVPDHDVAQEQAFGFRRSA